MKFRGIAEGGFISPEKFLREYWQKKPLFIPAAFEAFADPLTPDELAGLACEQEVESRLIVEHGSRPWQVEHGPFEEEVFTKLPETSWVLLVQRVDTLVPEVSDFLSHFSFIPNWRLDDVMISYAPAGGTVGAHTDNYDVFLIQGLGEKQWFIGDTPLENEVLLPIEDVRILKDFKPAFEWTMKAGDLLYVPPRFAHHGVATSDCLTYSVGFRAPKRSELISSYLDFLLSRVAKDDVHCDLALQKNPGEIPDVTLDRIAKLLGTFQLSRSELAEWFGSHVSAPHPAQPLREGLTLSEKELRSRLGEERVIRRGEGSRFAFYVKENGTLTFFLTGRSVAVSPDLRPLVEALCASLEIPSPLLSGYLKSAEAKELLLDLFASGELYFT